MVRSLADRTFQLRRGDARAVAAGLAVARPPAEDLDWEPLEVWGENSIQYSLHSLGTVLGVKAECDPAAECAAKLKGSIGEGSNHSNFSHQSSVKILSKFNAFC